MVIKWFKINDIIIRNLWEIVSIYYKKKLKKKQKILKKMKNFEKNEKIF